MNTWRTSAKRALSVCRTARRSAPHQRGPRSDRARSAAREPCAGYRLGRPPAEVPSRAVEMIAPVQLRQPAAPAVRIVRVVRASMELGVFTEDGAAHFWPPARGIGLPRGGGDPIQLGRWRIASVRLQRGAGRRRWQAQVGDTCGRLDWQGKRNGPKPEKDAEDGQPNGHAGSSAYQCAVHACRPGCSGRGLRAGVVRAASKLRELLRQSSAPGASSNRPGP